MNQQIEIYLALLLCSAALSFWLGAYAWRHRRDARVIEAISDGVLVVDSRGRVVEINPAAQKILACRASYVIGRQFVDAFKQIPALVQLFESQSPPYTVLVQGSGAAQTYCAARITPLTGTRGHLIGHLFVLRDFTRRKKAEEELEG